MLKAGEALLGVYTSLDPDWVYAGVIVHDMEKINEINSSELGIPSDYSRDGQLLGISFNARLPYTKRAAPLKQSLKLRLY